MADTPWRPSRGTVVAIGLLTLWPLLYMGLFLSFFVYMFTSMAHQQQGPPAFFMYIFPLHCFTMLLMFALTGVYVFHAYKTDQIPADKRVLWVVILFFGNMVAFPIYWYLYMWRATVPPRDA